MWIDFKDIINFFREILLNSTLYKQSWVVTIPELLPDDGRDKKVDAAFLQMHRDVLPKVVVSGSKPFALEEG